VTITTSNQYNNRLQPGVISASGPSATIFSHTFCYVNCYSGAPNANNGNVQSDTDNIVPANDAIYKYVTLNRLISAQATNQWGDAYTYDPFGNLYQKTQLVAAWVRAFRPKFQRQHPNQLSNIGLVYDGAGNVLRDNFGTQYSYDAENRIATAGAWSYSYDGDGKRVLRTSGPTAGSTYWYLPIGNLSDEVPLENTLDNQRDIYLNGRLVVRLGFYYTRFPNLYVLYDQIGSSRVSIDHRWDGVIGHANGPTYSNYYPFGGYITQPADATLEQRFTGKIRDAETGNDYFGARYFTSSMSRFMSPDWSAQAEPIPYAKIGDPQTLNLYSYVRNNPLSGIDVDGHAPLNCSGGNAAGIGCLTVAARDAGFGINSSVLMQVARFLGFQVNQGKRGLTYTTVKGGPREEVWQTRFQVSEPSAHSGFIVQEVFVYNDEDRSTQFDRWWEAWYVPSDRTATFGVLGGDFYDDQNQDVSGRRTDLAAKYYEGLTFEDLERLGFKAGSIPGAGPLWATHKDPGLSVDTPDALWRTYVAPK
jgi:RHS repeat-associated protein